MGEFPKIARERLAHQQVLPDRHPDADLLAAFVEQSLSGEERDQVLAHLSRCAECREVIALTRPEQIPATTIAEKERLWHEWVLLRWGGLTAALVVILLAVFLGRPRGRPAQEAAAPVTAENRNDLQGQARLPQDERDRDKAPTRTNGIRDRRFTAPKPKEETTEKTADRFDSPDAGKVRGGSLGRLAPRKGTAMGGGYLKPVPPPTGPAPAAANSAQSEQPTLTTAAPVQAPGNGLPQKSESKLTPTDTQQRIESEAPQVQSRQQQQAEDQRGRKEDWKKEQTPYQLHAQHEQKKQTELPPPTSVTESVDVVRPGFSEQSNRGALAGARPIHVTTLWTISQAGHLQRSRDSGRSWKDVQLGDVSFRAVSTFGSEVWAGGAAGSLFHSSDAGASWNQVQVRSDDQQLKADITHIDLADAQHITLQTGAAQRWTTSDGGRTWQILTGR